MNERHFAPGRLPILLMAAALLAEGGSGPETPLRAGPVYSPTRPERTVEVVVDLAPPPDLHRIPNYDGLKSRFTLIEEDEVGEQPEEVRPFRETERPAAIAIVVDVSYGMARYLPQVRQGIAEILRNKRSQDRVAIVAFGGDPRKKSDVFTLARFGAPPEKLDEAVSHLVPQRVDFPRLYMALDRALGLFAETDETFPARRRILLIAQGVNPSSAEAGTDAGYTPTEIFERARQLQIPIDAIAVPAAARGMTHLERDVSAIATQIRDDAAKDAAKRDQIMVAAAHEAMVKLASASGGIFFSDEDRAADLSKQLNAGFNWLMSSPVFKFRLRNLTFDGAAHHIALRSGSVAQDLPATIVLWQDTGAGPWMRKYGLLLLVGVVVLVILAVVLQSQQGHRRPGRTGQRSGSFTSSPSTPHVTPPPITPISPTPSPAGGNTPDGHIVHPVIGFQSGPRASEGGMSRGPTVAETPLLQRQPKPRTSTVVLPSNPFPEPYPGNPCCRFSVLNGSHAGMEFTVESQIALVGRDPGHAIACPFDPAMSNPHAEIRYQSGVVLITDLNSTNHTYLNGQLLGAHQPRALNPGDRIHMGGTDFEVMA